ncbi:MAG: hypothetical protein WC405_18570 [Syntrophales bacterium]
MKRRTLSSCMMAVVFVLSLTICSWATDYPSTVMIGQGATKDEAIQDAIRNAVESATGVFVYSASEVKEFRLVKDQIVTASRGYVKDFKVLEESKSDGVFFVKLNVSVDTAAIKSVIKRDMKTTTYDDVLKDYASISSIAERNKKYAEILKSISSRPLDELYKVDFSGYEILNAGTTSADVVLKFRIAPNSFLWDTYYEVVRQIGNSHSRYANENHIIINYNIYKNKYKVEYTIIGERIYFHEEFNDHTIKPRWVAMVFELPEGVFRLKPFRVYDNYIDKRYAGWDEIEIRVQEDVGIDVEKDSHGYFMGNGGFEFKAIHTFRNIDDIKKLPSVKVSLKDVGQKTIAYKWN